MDFLQHVGKSWGAEWKGILFRMQSRDLEDVIDKSQKWYPQVHPATRFKAGPLQEWRFPCPVEREQRLRCR